MALKTIYHFTALTGGAAGAIDSIDGESLLDKDRAFTIIGDVLYVHELDDDSGLAENSPGIIAPDTNAGDKRWILLGTRYIDAGLTFADLGTGFRLSGGTISKSLTVEENVTLPGQDIGTAPPTTGTWPQDWIRWKEGRVLGGFMGWTCTTAGTPGTWAEFGFISANEA
jgi:hypothetical protein